MCRKCSSSCFQSDESQSPFVLVLDEMNYSRACRTLFADALMPRAGPTKRAFPRNLFSRYRQRRRDDLLVLTQGPGSGKHFRVSRCNERLICGGPQPVDVHPGDPGLVHGLRDCSAGTVGTSNARCGWVSTAACEGPSSVAGRKCPGVWPQGLLRGCALCCDSSPLERKQWRPLLIARSFGALPRIHGSRKRVESSLCALGHFCYDLSYKPGTASSGSQVVFDPVTAGLDNAKLPLSLGRLAEWCVPLGRTSSGFTD